MFLSVYLSPHSYPPLWTFQMRILFNRADTTKPFARWYLATIGCIPPPLFRHRGGTIARTRFDRPPLYRVRRWNFLMHTDVKINCADRKDAALLNCKRHRKFHSAWYRRISPPTLLHDSVQTSGWQRHKGGNVRFENLWKPNWRMAQVAREFLRSN